MNRAEPVLNDILKAKPAWRAKTRSSIDRTCEDMLAEALFLRMLRLERKRTERTGRRFALMLLDIGSLLQAAKRDQILANMLSAVMRAIRDTDLIGWYQHQAVIGVIFTELGDGADNSRVHALSTKVTGALYEVLSLSHLNKIKVSFHIFPEDWDEDDYGVAGPATSTLRLALSETGRKRAALRLKRLIDIAGSLAALVLLSPLMVLIAAAVKLTSEGPVLFEQVRVGQYGRKFRFLKFRSMSMDNDRSVHEEYVKRFIAGSVENDSPAGGGKVYKLSADPRITRVGRFLRRTSLDELPQFFHVLKGEMSLVGPRPPVTYEVERYDLWHKRRLLSVRPGITGIWQVQGRSRVKFDEMVRLDIRYARDWSLWLDFKILLQTPRAVFSGDGAC